MRASRAWLVPAAILVAVAAGCSNTVVNTGEKAEQTEAPPPAAPTRPSNDKLVNAFDFFADTAIGDGGYYFISPSGAWRCVIVARMWAGCQSAGGSLGIAGAPRSVTDDRGQAAPPNAIVVRYQGDPQFAAVPADAFKPASGPAKTLPLNKILAAAGFRCNAQDAGISCMSEQTDKGFTFSAGGAGWQYTDLP